MYLSILNNLNVLSKNFQHSRNLKIHSDRKNRLKKIRKTSSVTLKMQILKKLKLQKMLFSTKFERK